MLPHSDEIEDKFIQLCEEYKVNPEIRSYSFEGRGSKNATLLENEFDEYIKKRRYEKYNSYQRETLQWIDSCDAGEANITIDAIGDVYPCNLLQNSVFKIGNILIDPKIDEKIKNFKVCSEFKSFINTPCENCEYNFCVGIVYLNCIVILIQINLKIDVRQKKKC